MHLRHFSESAKPLAEGEKVTPGWYTIQKAIVPTGSDRFLFNSYLLA
jgi:hypothetical protein